MAAGGTGDPTVSPDPRKRVRLNIALYVVVLLVACACVVGGVLAWRTQSDRADAAAEQERYGDVLAAARAEAEAFINIRYDDAQASIDEVVAGATGDFQEQYTVPHRRRRRAAPAEQVGDGRRGALGRRRRRRQGQRHGARRHQPGPSPTRQTQNKPIVRNFRLQLELVYEDGKWLTRDLQFVS